MINIQIVLVGSAVLLCILAITCLIVYRTSCADKVMVHNGFHRLHNEYFDEEEDENHPFNSKQSLLTKEYHDYHDSDSSEEEFIPPIRKSKSRRKR